MAQYLAQVEITKPTAPSVAGVYIGLDNAAAGGINICSSTSQYIDFASTGIDFKGRMLYNNDTFSWFVALSSTARLALSATALMFGTATLASSDKRLKFNERPFKKRIRCYKQMSSWNMIKRMT